MGVGWVSAEGEVSTVSPDSVAQLYQWDPLKKDISSVTIRQYVGCLDQNLLVYCHQWLTIIQFRGLNPIPELTIYLWKIYVYRASF